MAVGGCAVTFLLARFLETKPGTWPGDIEIGEFFIPLGRIMLLSVAGGFIALVLAEMAR